MKGKWHSGSGPDMVEQVESVDGVLEVGLLVVLVVVGGDGGGRERPETEKAE